LCVFRNITGRPGEHLPSVVAVVVDSVVVDFVDDVAFFLVAGFSVVFANSFLIICSVALIGFGLSVVVVVDWEELEEDFDASAFLFGRGPARNS
jgi:hypothetical protein